METSPFTLKVGEEEVGRGGGCHKRPSSAKGRTRGETARNAARERTRVKSLRDGFQKLQSLIPNVPPDTKLSKLDVLILATNYIRYMNGLLQQNKVSDPFLLVAEDDVEEEEVILPTETVFNEDTVPSSSSSVHHLHTENKYLHPVKKWPMRSRLYAGHQKDGNGPAFPSPILPTVPSCSPSSGSPSITPITTVDQEHLKSCMNPNGKKGSLMQLDATQEKLGSQMRGHTHSGFHIQETIPLDSMVQWNPEQDVPKTNAEEADELMDSLIDNRMWDVNEWTFMGDDWFNLSSSSLDSPPSSFNLLTGWL